MKKFVIVIFLHLFYSGYNQNWPPIPANEKSNYSLDNSNISNTLWVDSLAGANSYFNKIISPCPTCPKPYGWAYEMFLKDQPQFLGSYYTLSNNEIVFYSKEDSVIFVLKINVGQNINFVFDSINQINCILKQSNDSLIFNTLDSVKQYLLSNGDTIILSKNFGILKFPKFDNHKHYNLVGLQNQNKGILVPNYSKFTSLNIGDEFEFVESRGSRWLDKKSIQYVKVVNKISSSPAAYLVETKEAIYYYSFGIPEDTLVSAYYDTLTMDYDYSYFLDLYENSQLNGTQYGFVYKPVLLGYDSIFHCVTKSFNYYKVLVYFDDTLYSSALYGQSPNYQLVYGENRGLIGLSFNGNTSFQYNYWNSRILQGAKVNGTIYGTFTTDLFPPKVSEGEIKLYPNPTTNILDVLNLPSNSTFLNYSILNNCGKLIKQGTINNQNSKIDVSQFANGVYFLKLDGEQSIETMKFILMK